MMDRFSLLLLEPGEIYFDDFAVSVHKNPDFRWNKKDKDDQTRRKQPHRPQEAKRGPEANCDNHRARSTVLAMAGAEDGQIDLRGRLKVCSKSLVFVPQFGDHTTPLLKFMLAECTEIEEYLPKSFQSKLASEQNLMSVTAGSFIEMMEGGVTAPFKFIRDPASFVFSVQYGRLGDHLAQISQLRRAATLPPVEQNGMIAAIVYSRQNRLPFDACWLGSVQEDILLKTVGNKVTPLVVNPGRIVLTDARLYFQPYNNAERDPVVRVSLDSIRRIFQRRYLLRPLGLEIEYSDDRTRRPRVLYLTFNKAEDRQLLYHKLIQQDALRLADDGADDEHMTLKWQNGLVSNFDYLTHLNSAADRSFNDLTQYPVFPWVVADYTSTELDLEDPATFRDLSKPMGALNRERLEYLKKRREDMPKDKSFLYGSHYSTPGFVLYFLVRQIPECMLCLQNGRFDHPDRMFNSVPQTWINVTTHHSDFKELVPEFYMTEGEGSFLVNSRSIDFGVRQCGTAVGDVELPPWAGGEPAAMVATLREALECERVSAQLHKWIDLVFGFRQRGREADKADNVFYHLCYEGSVDMDAINSLEERYALEVQIGEFGQVPKQIFNSPHPQRRANRVPRPIDVVVADAATGGDKDEEDGGRANRNLAPTPTSPSSPSKSVIIASEVGDVKYWSGVEKLRRKCDYKPHRESVSCVGISVDRLWVFSSAHGDNLLKMYSMQEMRIVRSIQIPHLSISCLFPLPDNKTVLLGSRDNSLAAYSIEYGRTSDYLAIHR